MRSPCFGVRCYILLTSQMTLTTLKPKRKNPLCVTTKAIGISKGTSRVIANRCPSATLIISDLKGTSRRISRIKRASGLRFLHLRIRSAILVGRMIWSFSSMGILLFSKIRFSIQADLRSPDSSSKNTQFHSTTTKISTTTRNS
jgi:hypothetical protein